MGIMLLMDFGSTFTKGVMVDLEGETIVANASVPSTVESDVRLGLDGLLAELVGQASARTVENAPRLACSSAAGGLRMVVIGLVPELTVDAGQKAACNAGARVVGSIAGVMDDPALLRLAALKPDLILLAGGTDGGNKTVIVDNAELLAGTQINVPVIVAGNKNAAKQCRAVLERSGKQVVVSENVMPGVNRLNIEPVRETIRRLFIDRIAQAKGIDKVQDRVSLLMPTPNAVLQAVTLLALGTPEEEGLGDLLVIDVGGATTDVYSAGAGMPTMANVVVKGLPEPFIKRTVEGDLGVRHNALSILEWVGTARLLEDSGLAPADGKGVVEYCRHLPAAQLPREAWEIGVDAGLSKAAVRLGVERHAGSLERAYIPGAGETYIQTGKDLRGWKTVIGTGGPVVFSEEPRTILSEAVFNPRNPHLLKPMQPGFMLDKAYILYAVGLLAARYHRQALHVAQKNLIFCNAPG